MTQKTVKKRGRALDDARQRKVLNDPAEPDGRKYSEKRMFITTGDEYTKDSLIRNGFTYFAESNGRYYFAYDDIKIQRFSRFSWLKDVEFTDLLMFE